MLYKQSRQLMRMNLKILFLAAIALPLLIAAGFSEEDGKLDLKELEGDWEGVGEFLMPVTSVSMSLAGKARFEYDSTAGHLRTALTGEKYFFTYADSGHLRKICSFSSKGVYGFGLFFD